jgi:hypothetical protein
MGIRANILFNAGNVDESGAVTVQVSAVDPGGYQIWLKCPSSHVFLYPHVYRLSQIISVLSFSPDHPFISSFTH